MYNKLESVKRDKDVIFNIAGEDRVQKAIVSPKTIEQLKKDRAVYKSEIEDELIGKVWVDNEAYLDGSLSDISKLPVRQ